MKRITNADELSTAKYRLEKIEEDLKSNCWGGKLHLSYGIINCDEEELHLLANYYRKLIKKFKGV